MSNEIACDCADVPPTMPTCREEHLWDCPVACYQRQQSMGQDEMAEVFAAASIAIKADDREALAALINHDVKERAHAAWLRSRVGSSATVVQGAKSL